MMSTHQLVPPNGWQYREEKTNTTIVAMDWHDLIKCVKNHRESNGIVVGDIAKDISDQIKSNYPNIKIG